MGTKIVQFASVGTVEEADDLVESRDDHRKDHGVISTGDLLVDGLI